MGRVGEFFFDDSTGGAGTSVILAAGNNPNGLVIRTLTVIAAGGSASVKVGTDVVFVSATGSPPNIPLGEGLIIPAGKELSWAYSGAGSRCVATFDKL